MATHKKVLTTEDDNATESNGSLKERAASDRDDHLEHVLTEIASQASMLSAAPEEERATAPTEAAAEENALEIDLQQSVVHEGETNEERENRDTSEATLSGEEEALPETDGQRKEDIPEASGPPEGRVAEHTENIAAASKIGDGRSASDGPAASKDDPKLRRAALSVAVIIAFLLAADTTSIAIQDPEPALGDYRFSLLASDRHVQSGHSTRIALNSYPALESDLEFNWVVDKGKIEGTGQEVSYIAPHEPGPALVTATVTDKEGNRYQESIPVMIYKQYVILKADELAFDEATVIPVNWGPFLELIQDERIKASIGIKGESIERSDDRFHALIRALDASGLIEFWNNGYKSSSGEEGSLDEIDNVFISGSHSAQKADIARTQDLAGANLGIVFHTFGAPGNQAGEATASALKEIEEIDVWLFGEPSSGDLILYQSVPIEAEDSAPSFSKFLDEYESEQPYLILEVHPDEWDQAGQTQFQEIIKYLLGQNVAFTTPSEYYQIVNSQYVNLLCNGCTDVDMKIPILGSPEGSSIVGSVPHNTRVIALNTDTSSGIRHYQVVTEDVSGWVREWFVQEYSTP
jgi:hypothetical protein